MSWSDEMSYEDILYMQEIRKIYAQKCIISNASLRYLNREDIPQHEFGLHEIGDVANCAYYRLLTSLYYLESEVLMLPHIVFDTHGNLLSEILNESEEEATARQLISLGIFYLDNDKYLTSKELRDMALVYGVNPDQEEMKVVQDIKALQSLMFKEILIQQQGRYPDSLIEQYVTSLASL